MRQWDREKLGGWREKVGGWREEEKDWILYLTSLIQTVHLPPAMSRVDGQLVEVQVTKVLGEEETAKISSKSEHD